MKALTYLASTLGFIGMVCSLAIHYQTENRIAELERELASQGEINRLLTSAMRKEITLGEEIVLTRKK